VARSRYLRSELHQRSLQRTEAVDAISSLTVSLADAQAEVRQLRLVVSEAAADDEPAAAAAGDDEMAAALKKLAADMTDSQAKLRESYESKLAAVSAENEKLRQQVAGLHVDQVGLCCRAV
jgi:galactokinase